MDNSNLKYSFNNKYNILNKKTKSSFNEESPSKNFYRKSQSLNHFYYNQNVDLFQVIKQPYKKFKTIHTNRHNKYLFPFFYYFLDIIFDNLMNPKKFFTLSKRYFTVYNFMCQIYDISSHVILIKQFNILKNILKEKMHDDIYKLYSKININDYLVLEDLRDEFKHNKSLNFHNDS